MQIDAVKVTIVAALLIASWLLRKLVLLGLRTAFVGFLRMLCTPFLRMQLTVKDKKGQNHDFIVTFEHLLSIPPPQPKPPPGSHIDTNAA